MDRDAGCHLAAGIFAPCALLAFCAYGGYNNSYFLICRTAPCGLFCIQGGVLCVYLTFSVR